MGKNNIINESGAEGLSPGAEIGMLISAIVGERNGLGSLACASDIHPARAILDTLDSQVEASARDMARHEIDELADQIKLAARPHVEKAPGPEAETVRAVQPVNPFAPVPVVPPPVKWLGEAITAQEARDATTTWDRMAEFISDDTVSSLADEGEPNPEEGFLASGATISGAAAATAIIADHAPEPVAEQTITPPSTYQAPKEGFEVDIDDTAPFEETELTAMPMPATALGSSDNGWFGHSQAGLPIWLTTGVPVASVSLFALLFFMADPVSGPTGLDSHTAQPGVATQIAALPVAEDNAVLSAPLVKEDVPNAVIAEQEQVALVSARQDVLAARASAVFVPAIKSEAGNLPEMGLASAPSLKPTDLVTTAPQIALRTAGLETTASPLRPRRVLPVRMFSGRIDPGSAAAIVNAVAQQSGPELSQSEQFWLARDMERALDNEIDGRSVSLKSRQGQRVRVMLKSSRQVQREFSITRASEIAVLPHNMVLEGGWYAARRDTLLHATPALNAALRHRVLKRDGLIERMAIYTDRYGDRWYLMGQRGFAVGFVSAADVVLAGAHARPLGDPYAASQGARTHETLTVYTNCREGFIGPEGGLVQKMSVCRDAEGHWISHHQGQESTRQASLAGPLLPKAGTASAIVLAEATGDPIAYHAFGNRKFRRRLQGDLVYARFSQTTEHTLPNGDLIKFTFGERYKRQGVAPVLRVEALGALPSRLQVEAGWMKAPIGAKLRARPDLLSQTDLGEIPAGRAVETMGRVQGTRGEDWVLVGRSGVGFGYVSAAKLMPIEGRVSPYAISNVHRHAIAELTETTTTCRTVQYETLQSTGQFDACQQADASWALKAEPELRRQFAQTDADLRTAP